MPWTPAQHRLFAWAATKPQAAAAAGYHIPQAQAKTMMGEGITSPKEKVATALMQRRHG